MKRKEITNFLSELLISSRFGGLGKYWAKEVTLDYGSANVRRVDFMEFRPVNTISTSGIEKGEFICYEVKSCMDDYKSGHGQNFIAEKNYFVMPMSLYKLICSKRDYHIGVMVPIPVGRDKLEEFENPTELDNSKEWKLEIIQQSHPQDREKSIAELLFCMLRSGKN